MGHIVTKLISDVMGPRVANNDSQEPRIPLKPLICTLSLLEADTPENKLDGD